MGVMKNRVTVKVLRLMTVMIAVVSLAACNKLDISDHEIKFPSSGGEKSFSVSSDVRFVGLKDLVTHAFLVMNAEEDWMRYPFSVEGEWFVIERVDAETFTISAEPNRESGTRGFFIYLEDESLYDEITVYQKGN